MTETLVDDVKIVKAVTAAFRLLKQLVDFRHDMSLGGCLIILDQEGKSRLPEKIGRVRTTDRQKWSDEARQAAEGLFCCDDLCSTECESEAGQCFWGEAVRLNNRVILSLAGSFYPGVEAIILVTAALEMEQLTEIEASRIVRQAGDREHYQQLQELKAEATVS